MDTMGTHRKLSPSIKLRDAAWYFGPQRLRDEYNLAKSRPFPKLAVKPSAVDPANAQTSKFITESLNRLGAGGNESFEMERLLLEKLETGRLEAWGLRTLPVAGVEKEQIPRYYFEDRRGISFGSDRIKKLKSEFAVVEVRRPSIREEPIQVTPSPGLRSDEGPASRPRSGGRPSVQMYIDQAIEALKGENPSFCSLKRKAPATLVREYLRKRYEAIFADGRGLGASTIEKRIAASCRTSRR